MIKPARQGVVFHMMSALGELGRTRMTAVGNSHEDAKATYERAVTVLESGNGQVVGRNDVRTIPA